MKTKFLIIAIFFPLILSGQKFNGIETNLGNLFRLSDAKSRSISPENFSGEKGKGGMATEGTGSNASRDLGQGWKVSPYIVIQAGECRTLAWRRILGPPHVDPWLRPKYSEPKNLHSQHARVR